MNELGLEDEFVSDRLGTTHRAIDVFRTGEFQGTHNERLRIIKLLEEHAHPEAEAEYLIDCDLCERYYGVGIAIALIKGEQK